MNENIRDCLSNMDFNNLPENLSKEEIDYVIPKLTKRMKTMLAKIDNKEINGDKKYVKLLSLIKKKLLENRNLKISNQVKGNKGMKELKIIYEYFPDYSKEEINAVLKTLTEKAQKIIKLRYGSDLENPVKSKELTQIDNIYFASAIIKMIRKRLEEQRNPKLKKRKTTIYEYFPDYTKEEINAVIKTLTEKAQKIIKLRYGNDLENPVKSDELTKMDYQYFHTHIIKMIRKRLEEERNPELKKRKTTIYEYFPEYSKEEISKVIPTLTEKVQKIIKLRYGNDLENPIKSDKLTKEDNSYFNSHIIKMIRKKLEKQRNSELKKRKTTIYEYFPDYTKEEIRSVIKTLTEKAQKVIKLRYGNDLENPVKSEELTREDYKYLITNVIKMIEKRLQYQRNPELKKRKTIIYEYFPDYTKEEINAAIKTLTGKAQKVIKLRYGNDLENPVQEEKLSKTDYQYFYTTVIKMIRKKLEKNKILATNKKDELQLNNSVSNLIKNNQEINLITRDDYQMIMELLKDNNLANLFSEFTKIERLVIYLKFGFINNKYFTTQAIVDYLGISEKEVLKICKKFLLSYKKKVNSIINQAISLVSEKELIK